MLKKIWVSLLCLALVASAAGWMIQPAKGESEDAPAAFYHIARIKSGKAISIYASPNSRSEKIGTMDPADALAVVGMTEDHYRVKIGDQTGYVSKEFVRVSGAVSVDPLPEDMDGKNHLATPIPKLNTTHLELSGVLDTEQTIDTIYAYLWDERQYEVEQAYIRTIPTPTTHIDLSRYTKWINLANVMGGRKTLVLEGSSNGELFVLYRSPVYIRGENAEPLSVTAQCGVPESKLLDTKVSTFWKPTQTSPALVVSLPASARAALMVMEWNTPPDAYTVDLYDENQQLISSETRSTGFYSDWVSLPENARTAAISPVGQDCSMCTLRVYGEEYPAHVVQQWQEIPEKIDLLVVSTHQDDELLFLGGTIPAYAHREDVDLAVLYTATCSRLRVKEALDGLWTAGLKNHPIFLELPDQYSLNIHESNGGWKKYNPQKMIVEAIRRYRPEVIVCQDMNGEYGHGQHKLTAQLVTDGIQLAADESYEPEMAEQYGAWQVKKLYIHLYGQNQITMDWDQPLDDTGVITPLFLATEAYDKHRSQHASFNMERDGKKYDNHLFGLYYTAVGPDVEKNDFLENIVKE